MSGDVIALILGSQAFVFLIQFFVSRHFAKKDKNESIMRTVSVLTYNALSEKLERLLTKGFATPEERRDVKILYDEYKANGWNGDMDSRLERVYDLPTADLKKSGD